MENTRIPSESDRPPGSADHSECPGHALPALAGQRLARGVVRWLAGLNFAAVEEMPLPGRLRADVMALGPKGEIWIVECKSCRADFRADRKWQGYTGFCDRYFWAVPPDFPQELLPPESGLIFADAWGGELIRMAPETGLNAARRKMVARDFARAAAFRLSALRDPRPSGLLGRSAPEG